MAPPTRHVAFLGGINVGGHRVTMDRLRHEVAALGFDDVDTFIASGNVVFTAHPSAAHADTIAHGLAAALAWPVPTYVRTATELITAVDLEPFGPPADGVTDMILFCRAEPSRSIEAASSDLEQFEVHGLDVHWRIRGGVSDSGITLPKLPKLLGQPCTSRNVKSLRTLADRVRSDR